MKLNERIRLLRKDYLKLTQTEFGEKVGVSRSVIKNLELDVLAKPERKLPLIKLICKEFDVNEEWLLNGTEPMFNINKTSAFSLESYAKDNHITDLELQILEAYFKIPIETRKALLKSFLADKSDFKTDYKKN